MKNPLSLLADNLRELADAIDDIEKNPQCDTKKQIDICNRNMAGSNRDNYNTNDH